MYQICFLLLLLLSALVSPVEWTYSFAKVEDSVPADDSNAPPFVLSKFIFTVDNGV